MDSEQQRQTQEWLQKHWRHGPCPVCQASNFNLGGDLAELRPYQGGNLVGGEGPIYPVLPINCATCGYTILVNVLVAGIVTPT